MYIQQKHANKYKIRKKEEEKKIDQSKTWKYP